MYYNALKYWNRFSILTQNLKRDLFQIVGGELFVKGQALPDQWQQPGRELNIYWKKSWKKVQRRDIIIRMGALPWVTLILCSNSSSSNNSSNFLSFRGISCHFQSNVQYRQVQKHPFNRIYLLTELIEFELNDPLNCFILFTTFNHKYAIYFLFGLKNGAIFKRKNQCN